MEVSPEIYAWLSALNIIEPFNETDKNGMNNYFIPKKILNLLFNGEYFDIMIYDLQEAYNRYYDKRKDCTYKLKELVFKEKNFDNISEKTRLNNWNIINEALKIFNIKYSKNELNKVVNGNQIILLKIMNNIFNTITQYLKYSKKELKKDNNDLNIKNINIKENNNLNLKFIDKNEENISFNENNVDNRVLQNDNNNILNKTQNILKNINENYLDSSFNNSNFNTLNNLLSNKIDRNNINKSYINNFKSNSINNILDDNRPIREYVDIQKISGFILYENCTSTLEFFIVSLCKNFQINAIQAIGLLSNNRKYLSAMCCSGINKNFLSIKKWLEDLQINYDILLKLILKYKDGVYISYCIIGTALCSKNYEVSIYAIDLLIQLDKNFGLNNDWFIKIGINSFIFAFIKHNDKILYFLNIMCDFIKNDNSIFFNEIKKNIIIDEEYKTLIFDIIPNIISVSKKINDRNFFDNFKNFVFDICIHEETKLTYSCSILCECFFYYYQMIDSNLINKIILFFKKCLRNDNSNIYGSTIAKIFILINNLSKVYNQHAPPLYKILISLFIDMFDDLKKREIFLINFQNFLIEHKEIPMDIILDPYMDKLNNCNNYNLCDFYFLSQIITHPRIEYNDLVKIIKFLLSITFNNILFNKCAIFILEKILTEFIPNANINNIQIDELGLLFIDYINQILEIYMMKENNSFNGNLIGNNENEIDENEKLLEMIYIIIQTNFGEINYCVKTKLIECAKVFYYNNKRHSGIILGMLKNYEDFGNILFELEKI